MERHQVENHLIDIEDAMQRAKDLAYYFEQAQDADEKQVHLNDLIVHLRGNGFRSAMKALHELRKAFGESAPQPDGDNQGIEAPHHNS